MIGMSKEQFRRAAAMWGLALCLVSAAAGWMFMRFGQAWSIADLPISEYVDYIVPAYIVAETMMIPVGGKLIDSYGCRSILATAPLLYIVSSMLCILSPSVEVLVLFRFFQGIGAGLILALAFTSVGKYYEIDKRSKCNELMTGAFAIGSLFGSATGYFLTENFNWRCGFVFFSALMLIGFLVAWFLLPKDEFTGKSINLTNAALTALVFGLITFYTQMANAVFDVISIPSLVAIVVISLLVILLVHRIHTADDPILPSKTSFFEKILIILMFMFSLCGLGLIQYFFKLYLVFFEFDIYKASSMFLFMIAGAGISSMLGGKLIYKTGVRPWVIVGSIIVTIGLIVTHFIADKGVPQFAASLFVFGMGLGCIVTQIFCSMQCIVDKKDMGQHTGNIMGIRMIAIFSGSTIIGAYIGKLVHGHDPDTLDLSETDDIIAEIGNIISSGLKYISDSMDTGFLMTALVLAFITAALALFAFKFLGKDDLKALGVIEDAAEEEVTESSE